MKLSKALFSSVLVILLPLASHAEETETAKASEKKHFEVIDGTAPVTGEPGNNTEGARTKWSKACSEWKAETKELNKENQVLSLVCGSASCAYQENGTYVCSSTAVYKLKTEGIKAPPAPAPAPLKAEAVVTTPPPQLIVEVTPAALPGFMWVPGIWGWQSNRHIWYPGHWQTQRPGHVWIGHRWDRRGHGWHFETGHWGHGH